MTDRRPPPPPPPRLESYRPVYERAEQQGGRRPERREPEAFDAVHAHGHAPPHARSRGQPPHYTPEPHEQGGPSFLTSALFGFFALIVIAIAAAGVAVTMLPADFVRDRIAAAVKERTGRDLVIAGPASFTIYPSVGVSLKDVSLSSAPGMQGTRPLVSMKSLEARVELLPLISREVRIGALVMHQPVFNLEVDKQGRKSWEFAGLVTGERGSIRLAQAKTTVSDAPGGLANDAANPAADPTSGTSRAAPRLENVKLEDVRIVDGTVFYANAVSGAAQEVRALNMRVGAAALAAPLSATGSLAWRGQKVEFDGTMASLATALSDNSAKVTLALVTERGQASFEGSASFQDGLQTDGLLSANSNSLRGFLRWLGTELPPSKGFGSFETKGMLRTNSRAITLSSAEITLDGAKAHGQISLETAGARPQIKAHLKVSELNLNTYAHDGTLSEPQRDPEPEAQTDARGAAPQGAQGGAKSIDDLLAREPTPGPRVKGYTQRSGWNEEPYELTALGLADADAKLSIGRLIVRNIKAGQTELTVGLKNRNLKTTIEDVRLYEGRGRGFIAVDASSGKSAGVAANLTFEGISALPLLTDAAGIDKLMGKGRLAFTLAGQGSNEREVIETLNGKVDFSFADGAIVGINLPQMIRGLSQGKLGGTTQGGVEKTDFSEFASSWTVTAGVAQNQDLRLISPLLRLTGAGNVMLPAREVDYLLRPRLVASLTGQGGDQAASGLEIPVRMQGSWEQPRFAPDLSGIVSDPTKAVETFKEIGKQFKGKNAGEIVDGLLGKGGSGGSNGGSAPAKKLLEQFLNP